MRHLQSALLGFIALGAIAVVVPAQTTQPPYPRNRAMMAAPGMRMGPRLEARLLRGITLSDAERARVKAAREKFAPQFKAMRETAAPELKAMRDARQRGDSAAVAAIRQKLVGQRQEMRQLVQQMNSEIRAGLSPENQAKFDANQARLRNRQGKMQGWRRGNAAPPER